MDRLVHILIGTWFVCSSNFPMWTKGNKTSPAFTYGLVTTRNGTPALSDEVRYVKHRKTKFIRGTDYPDTTNTSTFTWRGRGVFHLLKSKWKVVAMDAAQQWAVIYFSKTAFTPEGLDIISRDQKLSAAELKAIKSLLSQNPLLNKQVIHLKDL